MPCKLGVLVPSSNTALEPLTTAIVASLGPEVTVHLSRFPVTKITLDASGLAQFSLDGPIMSAVRLLADAKVDVIGWSGTSGGWLGFGADEKLCQTMTETLGIPATTSTLALNKALGLVGAKKLALVTPYLGEVQDRIVQVYTALVIRLSQRAMLASLRTPRSPTLAYGSCRSRSATLCTRLAAVEV